MDRSDPDFHPQGTEAVILTAQEAVEPRALQREELYAVRDRDGALDVLDLEKFRATPDRPRGSYMPATVDSLIDYVNAHEDPEHTTVWVHPTAGKVVVVLDDNAKGRTAWRQHLAILDLVETEEWKFWMGLDGHRVGQEAFAEHLQDGLPDILEPDGATLLEIAQTFQSKTEVTFRKGVDITSGEVKFQYDEEQQTSAGAAGQLAVPRKFKLLLSPFVGEKKVEIVANLRHRTGKGTLEIGYKLEHPERVVQGVLDGIADHLDKEFGRVYRGQPAA